MRYLEQNIYTQEVKGGERARDREGGRERARTNINMNRYYIDCEIEYSKERIKNKN